MSSDILSDISCDILSDISFDILSDISSYKTFRFTGSRVSAHRSGAHRSEGFL